MNKWVSPLTGQLVEQEVAEAHALELRATAEAYYEANERDMVEHPDHYQGAEGLEVITVIRAFGLDDSFELGNAVKYLLRSKKKSNMVQDIKKARQVLDMWLDEHDEKEKK